jgi:hypothetical protein
MQNLFILHNRIKSSKSLIAIVHARAAKFKENNSPAFSAANYWPVAFFRNGSGSLRCMSDERVTGKYREYKLSLRTLAASLRI